MPVLDHQINRVGNRDEGVDLGIVPSAGTGGAREKRDQDDQAQAGQQGLEASPARPPPGGVPHESMHRRPVGSRRWRLAIQ